jgi:hypothetical protein
MWNVIAFFAFWAVCFGCLLKALSVPVEREEEITVNIEEKK